MTDDCSSIPGAIHSVFDEGTFDIFQYDGTYYWVAFHGFDGVNGYRSIAKTADFISWVAGNNAQGVPEDAIFDRNDSQTWRETWNASQSIGGGHGTIYKEGSQYYQLVEGADMNLACVDNQKWDFGLYRTTTLTSTSWTPIPSGNPILYSGRTADEAGGTIAPCNIQYTSIFKDPSTGYIWMTYGRNSHVDQDSDALYWFRLEKTGNLLKNSDLWRADTSSFLRTGSGTNWAAWRIPGNSYDATPYLAMNCGGTCGSDNSVYQDVAFTPSGQTAVSASLKALLESGTGNISLAVWQLDSTGSVIKSDSYTVAADGSWKTYSLSGTMSANTKTLRFQMYLNGNATFRVDDLVLKAL